MVEKAASDMGWLARAAKPEQPLQQDPSLTTSVSTAPSSPPNRRNMPQWLNHFNRRDLTTTLRCTVSVWIGSLLMFIHPTLHRLGQATFLAGVVSYMLPPAGNVIVLIIGILSMLLGICFAWKKATLCSTPYRNKPLPQHRKPAEMTLQLVNDGFMLDARITAVYFVMGLTFIYFLCRLRYANNKVALFQVWGIITTDIFLLFGPVLPSWDPFVPELVVLPAACGSAIAIACALIIFPQSTSQVALGQIQDLLLLLKNPIETGRRMAAGETDIETNILKYTQRRGITLYALLQPSMSFIHLDLSRGLWSGHDVKSVYEKLQNVLATTFAFLDLQVDCLSYKERVKKLDHLLTPLRVASPDDDGARSHNASRHKKRVAKQKLFKALIEPGPLPRLNNMTDALSGNSQAVLDATDNAISRLAEAILLVNMNRWFVSRAARARLPEIAKELRQICSNLALAREAYVADVTNGALHAHGNLFDEEGLLKVEMKGEIKDLTSIMVGFVIQEHISTLALAFESLTSHVAQLLEERTTNQVWGPLKLGKLWFWMTNSSDNASAPGVSGSGIEDPDRMQQHTSEVKQRFQIVSQGRGIPKRRGNILSRLVVDFFEWLTNAGGLYALRVVVVTIATGIPAVIPYSAGFFYREKGIWTVVSAQTCILMYMSDFTFSVFTRLAGTIAGGLTALVIWYIGSGNGEGNPFGLAAALPFGIVVFIWARLWLPGPYMQGITLGASTFAMIIGYSYDMHHLPTSGLPGVGYESFWKRLLSVLIGFAAALVVQMLPSPPSGSQHVAKTLANSLHRLSDHYAVLVSHWAGADPTNSEQRGTRDVIRAAALDIAQKLFSLNEPISMLQLELSMSPFDQATLGRAQELLIKINRTLSKMMIGATSLPLSYQKRLVENAGILDETSIDNIMAVLVITKQSLRSGAPLPERMPMLLQTCYVDFCAEGNTVELHREDIGSENYLSYCVVLSSYLRFLHCVDELVVVLKEAAGETHIIHDWGALVDEVV